MAEANCFFIVGIIIFFLFVIRCNKISQAFTDAGGSTRTDAWLFIRLFLVFFIVPILLSIAASSSSTSCHTYRSLDFFFFFFLFIIGLCCLVYVLIFTQLSLGKVLGIEGTLCRFSFGSITRRRSGQVFKTRTMSHGSHHTLCPKKLPTRLLQQCRFVQAL